MSSHSMFYKLCLLLAIVGGLNWGVFAIWQLDMVAWLLGGQAGWPARIVYLLVGLASICLIPALFAGDSREKPINEP